jgi:hypothetical protein
MALCTNSGELAGVSFGDQCLTDSFSGADR